MANRRSVAIAVLAVVLGVGVTPCGMSGEVTAPASYVIPVRLEPVERERIPLPGQSTVLVQRIAGASMDASVSLRRTGYLCVVDEVEAGHVRRLTRTLQCYELDSDAPYGWSVWTLQPVGHARLLRSGQRTYLAWVVGSVVYAADVSVSKDRCVSLQEYFSAQATPDVAVVPVGNLVPDAWKWGVNALYSDIDVVGVSRDDKGVMTVQIRGPEQKEVITLVSGPEGWRVK